jgi:hypothetical protein
MTAMKASADQLGTDDYVQLRISALVALLLVACLLPVRLRAQTETGDCYLDSFRQRVNTIVNSIVVEQEERTITTNARGERYEVVDVSFSGSVDGCVVLTGPVAASKPNYSWLHDIPDISITHEHLLMADGTKPYPLPLAPDSGNKSPRYYVRGRFNAKDGAGIRFFYPANRAAWNEKLQTRRMIGIGSQRQKSIV